MKLILVILVALVGCTQHSPTAQCKLACEKRLQVCQLSCRDDCRQCASSVNQSANCTYNRYRHEQYIRGAEIARELQSYRDPLQCRKITCECMADYQVCTQACTGVIRKRLQVAPTCC